MIDFCVAPMCPEVDLSMRNIQINSNFISPRFLRDMGYCPRHSRLVMLTNVPTHYRYNKKSGPCL